MICSSLQQELFFQTAFLYLLKWCPFQEDLLVNAQWIDFTKRHECTFNAVEYFIHRYPSIFQNIDLDKLNEEFLAYQSMSQNDIPQQVQESVGLTSNSYLEVDVF